MWTKFDTVNAIKGYLDKAGKLSMLQKNIYQGQNPTAQYSQKIILQALNELLQTKPFNAISVSELCRRSGVSRQTFYTLFGSKENILLYQLGLTEQADHGTEIWDLQRICAGYADFVADNFATLKELFDNGLSAVLHQRFYQAMAVCQTSFVGVNADEQQYVAEFMAGGLCHLTKHYMQHHSEPDRTELSKLAFKVLSGSVYRTA